MRLYRFLCLTGILFHSIHSYPCKPAENPTFCLYNYDEFLIPCQALLSLIHNVVV
jgi:hypothetical protein